MNDTPGWASPGSAPSDDQRADGRETGVPHPSEPADDTAPSGVWATHQARSTPGPGWGTPPQGAGWGGPPPAPKPGVIPLRPLGIGEIIDGTVSSMRTHWRTILGATLGVSVIAQTAIVLVQRYALPAPPEIDSHATGSEALRQATESLRYSLLDLAPPLLISMLATIFTTSVLTVVISRSVLGRPVTLSEAWAEARPRLLPLLGLTLLLAVMGGAIMTAGVLPGFLIGDTAGAGLTVLGLVAAIAVFLWLSVRFSLAAPALMLERQPIAAALRRSVKLVRDAWWRTFGVLALTGLLTVVVALVVGIPFGLVAVGVDDGSLSSFLSGEPTDFGWPFLIVTAIGDVVAATLTYPLSAGIMALLYVDQRIRREALDLDLTKAAALPAPTPQN